MNLKKNQLIRDMLSPVTDIQASHCGFILEIRQLMSSCDNFSNRSAALFTAPGDSRRSVVSCNCPPQNASSMLYSIEVWISGWAIYPGNIFSFQKIVYPINCMSPVLSFVKMKSGPYALLKRRIYGSKISSLSLL